MDLGSLWIQIEDEVLLCGVFPGGLHLPLRGVHRRQRIDGATEALELKSDNITRIGDADSCGPSHLPHRRQSTQYL